MSPFHVTNPQNKSIGTQHQVSEVEVMAGIKPHTPKEQEKIRKRKEKQDRKDAEETLEDERLTALEDDLKRAAKIPRKATTEMAAKESHPEITNISQGVASTVHKRFKPPDAVLPTIPKRAHGTPVKSTTISG